MKKPFALTLKYRALLENACDVGAVAVHRVFNGRDTITVTEADIPRIAKIIVSTDAGARGHPYGTFTRVMNGLNLSFNWRIGPSNYYDAFEAAEQSVYSNCAEAYVRGYLGAILCLAEMALEEDAERRTAKRPARRARAT